MRKSLAPENFGLHRTTIIEQLDPCTYSLVIRRKSRVIMADGRKLLEKVGSIKEVQPDASVIIESSAPVCSKTKAFLAEHGIEVKELSE